MPKGRHDLFPLRSDMDAVTSVADLGEQRITSYATRKLMIPNGVLRSSD